jgi:predicted Zn-dependent protease with MMP-like domain
VIIISDKEFEKIVSEGIDAIPPMYQARLQNVAFLVEDNPTPQQRTNLNLHPAQTLLGLYEGLPLPQRGGMTKMLPDKITLFKSPLLAASQDIEDLKKQVKHTIWHEVAHYYGLNHDRIYEIERKHYND